MKVQKEANKPSVKVTDANIQELLLIAKQQKALIDKQQLIICQQEYTISRLKGNKYDYI